MLMWHMSLSSFQNSPMRTINGWAHEAALVIAYVARIQYKICDMIRQVYKN